MQIDDMGREQMVEAAKKLVYCLENEADEDAFNWLMALTHSLYKSVIARYLKLALQVWRSKT